MEGRLGLAEKGEGDAAKQAFHFRSLLQRSGVDAVPPLVELRIHLPKGWAGHDVLWRDGDEVALHVVHLIGIDLEQSAFELSSNERPVFFVLEPVGVENGVATCQHAQATVQMKGVGPGIVV